MVSFDRAIPPAEEGKITFSVRTRGYEGPHRWGAKVNTNDTRLNVVYMEVIEKNHDFSLKAEDVRKVKEAVKKSCKEPLPAQTAAGTATASCCN